MMLVLNTPGYGDDFEETEAHLKLQPAGSVHAHISPSILVCTLARKSTTGPGITKATYSNLFLNLQLEPDDGS